MRCQTSAVARACGVAGLALVMSFAWPTPVGQAQSTPPLTPWRGFIDHVSATVTGGVPQTGVEVSGHAISGDGRFVVMQSLSQDLVANDVTWVQDVFLRDRQTGTMTRLSIAEDGTEADGFSDVAAISTNGRHVVFASSATNLVAGDTNATSDIFVRDLDAARTVRVSVATDGSQSDGYSYFPVISATGRFVAFISQATTLAPGPAPYGPNQVYLHDRDADGNGTFDEAGGTATTLESVSSSGAIADSFTQQARVSADGRLVLFESTASNLDPVGNPNQSNHVYVRDRQAGTTTLIDRAMTGGPSIYGTDYRSADMTDDGRFITYTTYSTDIVLAEGNWNSQVLRYDSQAEGLRTSIVSVLPDGTLGNGYSYDTSISADGRYVAFRSTSNNLATPAQPADWAGVFVRDMTAGTFTRVDVLSSGEGFDSSFPYAPSISADGTAVAFMSPAMNAVDGQYTFGSQHSFVATAFSVGAIPASFPMAGGTGSVDVNTLPVSGWNAVSLDPWIALTDGGGFAAGPRTVTLSVEANPSGIVRHGRVKLGSTIVAIQQDGDGDTTPPVVTPIVTGTLHPSGWYTSDITVQWSVSDPDSEVTIGYGCFTTTFTSDFIYSSPACEATSHGGTTTVSLPLRRDTTPPSITINSPLSVFYQTGATITPAFGCLDNPGSGVASCQRTGGSGPLDSTTPGWRPFTVTATDQAGNTASKTVEYLIGTGACVAQFPSLKAWWRFNGSMFDTVDHLYASPSYASGWFDNAVAGQGWTNGASQNYLVAADESRLSLSSAMTVAMWVKPIGFSGANGTLVTKPAHYRIARYPDGTLRWAFSRTTGYAWVNTGVVIPYQHWSHVALTYDNGVVKSYVNGRLVHTQTLGGSPASSGDPNASLTIGGRADLLATLSGTYDDVQIYDGAMTAAGVEALAQAGGGSVCVPNGSTLTVSAPASIGYGATFRVTAVLRDEAGDPIPNRQVWLNSHVAPGGFAGGVSGTTDAAGQAYADLPVSSSAALGPYTRAASAVFEGDVVYREASAQAAATLVAGTPVVTWAAPAAIVYGTALGGTQLNATSSVQGAFSYSPADGTVLDAGTHTLSVTFTPNDSSHWATTTKTTTVTVNQAAPVVSVTGGTFTYDAQPHAGSGTATGVLGEALSPVQLRYDGASEAAPVDAGTHTVRASFAGSANYAAAESADAALVINKATPSVSVAAETATYDGQPHGASATAVGVGGESLTPIAITYNGSPAVPVNAGAYAVEARYDGSGNYNAAAGTTTLTIVKAVPNLQWVPGPGTIVHGTPLGAAQLGATANVPGTFSYSPAAGTVLDAGTHTLTATFTPTDAANVTTGSISASVSVTKATPSVTWANPDAIVYGTALSGVQLNASANVPGTFAYSPSAGAALVAGSHVIAVTFTPADGANYSGASTTRTLTVARAPLAIVANNAAKPFGAPLPAFSATPAGFANGDSMASLGGSLTLATSATASSPVGAYPIVPQGLTSPNYDIAFVSGTLTVARADTAVAILTSPNPAGFNQPVTYSATVAVLAPGAGAPSGVVQFFDGGTLVGTSPLAAGSAFLMTNGLTAGSHSITATYSGDASFGASSATTALTVRPSSTSSTTTVTSTRNPANIGQSVTFRATVAAPSGGVSGTVDFYDGSVLLGSGVISAGVAQFTTTSLPSGGHAIAARYRGNASLPPSVSTALAQTVGSQSRSSSTAVSISPSPAALGTEVTITATVTGGQQKAPTGSVLFIVNGQVLEEVPVIVTGNITSQAVLRTSALPRGTHSVVVVYLADPVFRASSRSTTLTVN